MQRMKHLVVGVGLAVVVSLVLPGLTSAHEGREVANGQYELVVGFLDEPAFAGEKNAMIVEVSRSATGAVASPTTEEGEAAPVEGLNNTLKAEVFYGDQRMELDVRPLFGQPGSYVGYFFPMAEGDYSFRVFGDIEGNAIDETFTSGPETFAAVQPREPLEFPKQSASNATVLGFPVAIGAAGLMAGGILLGRKRLRRA